MAERNSDRWVSITQSVLLHAAVVGALAYGWYAYKQVPRQPTPTLAIEGSVVSSKDVPAAPPAPAEPPKVEEPITVPAPQTPPEPVEDVGPPTPTPEEIAQQQQAELEAQQKIEAQRKAEEEKVAAERAAQEKARQEAEQKKRQEEQRAAEEKRQAEAKKQAEEKRKAEEARLRAQREADLRKSLEAEERAMALRSSGVLQTWLSQITSRIQRAWLRPPSARPGIDCMVYVTQVPGGEVTNVRIGTCNGDAAVRESIESAVYRASPLPPPPDPALFERNLEIRFIPAD